MKPKGVKKADPKAKKDKTSQQRLRTFNSSEFSQWEEKNHMLSSATDLALFKNQSIAKKRITNSALSQYGKNPTAPKPLSGKSKGKKKKKQIPQNNKQTRSKSKLHIEQYEKVKYKESSSNSEIVFSNDETKRSSAIGHESNIIPNIYLHQLKNGNKSEDSNLVLRVNIKRQYTRKVEAAVKIQKVFRGYLTRKILMKYVIDSQIKLKG